MLLRNPLQQLLHLNRSSPNFHDQLVNLILGKKYKECVQDLQGADLVRLIEYLGDVCIQFAFLRSPLNTSLGPKYSRSRQPRVPGIP